MRHRACANTAHRCTGAFRQLRTLARHPVRPEEFSYQPGSQSNSIRAGTQVLEGFQGTDVFALGQYMQRDLNMLTDSRCHPPSIPTCASLVTTLNPVGGALVYWWRSAKTRHRALARLLAVITAPAGTVRVPSLQLVAAA